MLYLRYSTDQPDKICKPKPILPMSLIAELLDTRKETLNWLHRKYFTERPKSKTEATNVSVRNIMPEEILFLVDSETLTK